MCIDIIKNDFLYLSLILVVFILKLKLYLFGIYKKEWRYMYWCFKKCDNCKEIFIFYNYEFI